MNGSRLGCFPSTLLAYGRRMLLAGACLFALATFDRPAYAVAMLQDLFNGGFVDAGNARFSDWQLVSLDATFAPPPDLSQIAVVPLVDDPMNPGLQFIANGQLSVSGLNSIDLLIEFRVSPLPGGGPITGHTLELTGVGGNGGIAYVSEEVADGMGGDLGPALVIADSESNYFQLLDDSGFAPQAEISVTMNVFVAGLSDADSASVDMFAQRFSQVPEPSAILLALVALPLLVCLRRAR